MLNKEELNYLAMLVTIDQRTVVKKFRNNNQLEECNTCKYVKTCFSKRLNWGGKYCGIRELERRCKK